ncbi:monooxygenase [Staphylococcus gallinarum]|uniref:monooxygenase n=1 Tax=Staphylococcus gallinarum TaxID=1293 RepID=UPI001E31774C|nr:monooxygenase [Staphylococcus gallinarum]MCD8843969.1 monooxygenase [Staphylococcus gallinarum]
MTYILQIDFPITGPFGIEMTETFSELARSITKEPGFLWKIWTENENTQEAGGIYAFTTEEDAQNYLTMHTQRLIQFGITDSKHKIFKVNEGLTKITHKHF